MAESSVGPVFCFWDRSTRAFWIGRAGAAAPPAQVLVLSFYTNKPKANSVWNILAGPRSLGSVWSTDFIEF